MALTVVITRDVEDRYRGFLASAMLEVAPGVYASPTLSARARGQVWEVMTSWHAELRRGSVTLIHPDKQAEGGLVIQSLGTPSRRAIRLDGVLLSTRENPSGIEHAP